MKALRLQTRGGGGGYIRYTRPPFGVRSGKTAGTKETILLALSGTVIGKLKQAADHFKVGDLFSP